MTRTSEHAADWRCRVGRHHYVGVADDNPEMRGQAHLECERCGQVKDIASYRPPPPGGLSGSLGSGRSDG